MSQNIVCVGFKCPVCQRRVVVLSSSDPVPQTATVIVGACRCGFVRPIPMVEVQSLEVVARKRDRAAPGNPRGDRTEVTVKIYCSGVFD